MDNKLTNFVFDGIGVDKVHRFLNVTSLRQKLVAENIANVSTPGYQAQKLDFKDELKKVTSDDIRTPMHTTHRNHIPLSSSPERGPKIHSVRLGQDELNSVNIEEQVTAQAENEILYTAGATMLQRKFAGIKNAIVSE